MLLKSGIAVAVVTPSMGTSISLRCSPKKREKKKRKKKSVQQSGEGPGGGGVGGVEGKQKDPTR